MTIPGTRLPSLKLTHSASVKNTGSLTTHNWSGYADIACPTCSLRYVSADFTVPHLNTAKSPDNSWACRLGWPGRGHQQHGRAGRHRHLCLWRRGLLLRLVRDVPGRHPGLCPGGQPGRQHPGQLVDANGTYYLSLNDTTLGAGFSATATVPAGVQGQNKSAEVITEAPSEVSGQQPDPAPARRLRPGQLQQRDRHSRNGTHGGLGSTSLWNGAAVKMVGSSRATLSTPSGLLTGPTVRHPGLGLHRRMAGGELGPGRGASRTVPRGRQFPVVGRTCRSRSTAATATASRSPAPGCPRRPAPRRPDRSAPGTDRGGSVPGAARGQSPVTIN